MINDELLLKIGEMSASIEASRNDANNRFSTLLDTVKSNKSEFDQFKKEVREDIGNIKQTLAKWSAIGYVPALISVVVMMTQIWMLFHK